MYKIIILPVDLCVCETWSLTFTEERRLRVFDNRVLRRIFGLKRHEVIRVCKEELYALYSSPNIIRVVKSRRMRQAEIVAPMTDRRDTYRVLVGKPEERRVLG
jgi:hypothetical protein